MSVPGCRKQVRSIVVVRPWGCLRQRGSVAILTPLCVVLCCLCSRTSAALEYIATPQITPYLAGMNLLLLQ